MASYSKPIKVWYEYDGLTYEFSAHSVALDYVPLIGYYSLFSNPSYMVEGKLTCSFIGKPKVLGIKVKQLEESTESYFGEQVQFIFVGNKTICFIGNIVGVANCSPNDKYNRDYGKLLAFQRAKEIHLYGKVK